MPCPRPAPPRGLFSPWTEEVKFLSLAPRRAASTTRQTWPPPLGQEQALGQHHRGGAGAGLGVGAVGRQHEVVAEGPPVRWVRRATVNSSWHPTGGDGRSSKSAARAFTMVIVRRVPRSPGPRRPRRCRRPDAGRWRAPGVRREFRATWAAARAREGEADPARPIESRREVGDIDVRSIRCAVKVCAALGGPFRRRRLPCRAAPGVRPQDARAESGPTTRSNGFVLGVEKVVADSCATSSHSRQPLLRSTRKPDG
jgi:hypothetical protein